MRNNNLQAYLSDFRCALAECPELDDHTQQVLLLKVIEGKPYLVNRTPQHTVVLFLR